jgi:hypothetical protein
MTKKKEVKMKKLLLITCGLAMAAAVEAQIIHVPDDYPTIQLGINHATTGDTVLVDPGTYPENLFLNRNIVLASLYLITQDTSYISQTIIDGCNLGRVIKIEWVDTTCRISGFTIINGYIEGYGAGIACTGASPVLSHLVIKNNQTENGWGLYGRGGGIACVSDNWVPSSPRIRPVEISGNTSVQYGGGLYVHEGHTYLEDVAFHDNSCWDGSAIYIEIEDVGDGFSMKNVNVFNNISDGDGMTIYFWFGEETSISIENVNVNDNSGNALVLYSYDTTIMNHVILSNNKGFGLQTDGLVLTLSNVSIHDNEGGLINCSNEIIFDTLNRCSIYNNFIGYNKEIESNSSMEVVLDTFTVLNPTSFHVNALPVFSFDILHGLYGQINSDVYVSPSGDDLNSGISTDQPLKRIVCAQAKLLSPHTIYLAGGNYSNALTGESFPVVLTDSINLAGSSADDVILEGSGNFIIEIKNNTYNKLAGITLTGGRLGIWIENSSPVIEDVHITGNSNPSSYYMGGGVRSTGSNPLFINVIIEGNSANSGGGLYFEASYPIFINTIINGNTANSGGGIYFTGSNPVLLNLTIKENTASDGGGIYFLESNPVIINLNANQNSAQKGGGIYFYNSDPVIFNSTLADNIATIWGGGITGGGGSNIQLFNSILWNNEGDQIALVGVYSLNTIDISYSDIQEGEEGIYISGTGTVNWLEGNTNEDPLFAGSGEHPYALSDISPCIDAGIPDTTGLNLPFGDIIGNKRIWDGDGNGIAVVDMGAYEFGSIPVGVQEPQILVQDSDFKVRCYPNPTYDKITISSHAINSITQLSIFNVSGEKVMERQLTNTETQLDISALPRGVYFVRVQDERFIETVKMIKQ